MRILVLLVLLGACLDVPEVDTGRLYECSGVYYCGRAWAAGTIDGCYDTESDAVEEFHVLFWEANLGLTCPNDWLFVVCEEKRFCIQ